MADYNNARKGVAYSASLGPELIQRGPEMPDGSLPCSNV